MPMKTLLKRSHKHVFVDGDVVICCLLSVVRVVCALLLVVVSLICPYSSLYEKLSKISGFEALPSRPPFSCARACKNAVSSFVDGAVVADVVICRLLPVIRMVCAFLLVVLSLICPYFKLVRKAS